MISRPPVTSELELRLNADNPPPTTVLFAQQLKSTLGDALKLMLPLLFHVHQVSVLVPRHAAAGHHARRRRTLSATLEPPPSTLARASASPDPTEAHPRRSAAARAPPPPGTASAAAAASLQRRRRRVAPLRRRRRRLFRCPAPRARAGPAWAVAAPCSGRRWPQPPRAVAPAPASARPSAPGYTAAPSPVLFH